MFRLLKFIDRIFGFLTKKYILNAENPEMCELAFVPFWKAALQILPVIFTEQPD